MPVLPSEDAAPAGLTEKLAKDPSSQTESTASSAGEHANEHNPLGGDSTKASSQDFISKGPQIVDELPTKMGKEELRARAEELNK